MKRIVLLLSLIASIFLTKAQCGSHYTFKEGVPVQINDLGVSPQFDFLRNIESASDFIKKIKDKTMQTTNPDDFTELNKILKEIGFNNGISDEALNETSINKEIVPYGTIGNLGNTTHNYLYSILLPKGESTRKAWKIMSPTGCSVYIFLKCGNAFFPKPCISTPLNECPKVTINIEKETVKLECESPARFMQTITIETWGYYTYKKRQTIHNGKSTYKARVEVEDSILISSDTIVVEKCDKQASDYTVILPEFTTTQTFCADTTITLPIRLKQLSASSTSHDGRKNKIIRRFRVQLNKKLFKHYRKITRKRNIIQQ